MDVREASAKYVLTTEARQSEIGLLPADWRTTRLDQLVRSVEYGSAAKSNASGQVAVLRMVNLQGGKIDWTDLVFTNNEAEIVKYALQPGDVLFNRTNTVDLVGKTSIYRGEQPAIFAGYLIRINVNHELLNPEFLNYVLNAEFSRKYSAKVLSVAVGQANINGEKLKTYPIPLPPNLKEQRAVAEALGDTDALIESLQQLIAKKRQIKQGAMRALLTGKQRLPGFDDAWKLKALCELADMRSGGTPPSSIAEYYDGDIPWVSISDITRSGKWIVATERNLSALGLSNSAAQILPAGTILYAMYASLGECSIAGVPLSSSQAILGIRCKSNLDADFLYYFLSLLKSQVQTIGQQGTQSNLNKNMVEEFEILLPPVAEQTSIATALCDMDAEIAALESRLAKTRDLKQGMMQALLTGRIRLPLDNAA